MEENTDLMNHWTMPRKETQEKKMTVAGIESSSLCYGLTFGSSIDSRSTPYIELCWQNHYVVNTKRSHPTQLRCPQYFTCALFAFNTTAARLERSLLKNGARSRCIFGSPVARFKLEGPNGIHSLKLNKCCASLTCTIMRKRAGIGRSTRRKCACGNTLCFAVIFASHIRLCCYLAPTSQSCSYLRMNMETFNALSYKRL